MSVVAAIVVVQVGGRLARLEDRPPFLGGDRPHLADLVGVEDAEAPGRVLGQLRAERRADELRLAGRRLTFELLGTGGDTPCVRPTRTVRPARADVPSQSPPDPPPLLLRRNRALRPGRTNDDVSVSEPACNDRSGVPRPCRLPIEAGDSAGRSSGRPQRGGRCPGYLQAISSGGPTETNDRAALLSISSNR